MSEIELSIAEATAQIHAVGDPVSYRGCLWYLIRRKEERTEAAIKILDEAGLLERWSKKTPNLVRVDERPSDESESREEPQPAS
jgi:hypothetical protein